MNSKKLLSMLLVSLGAFSLVLTGCEKKNSDSASVEPSNTPSVTPSVTPSDTPSDKPSETPSDKPSETPSEKPSETPSEKPSETPSDSSTSEVVLPEATTYEVTFNYDEPESNLTVWTDYAIDQSIAPITKNVSKNPDTLERRTAPLATGGYDCGMYFFAIDENGYIVYASYGLGVGYGSPSDGYYHNQETKDIYSAPYWALHERFEPWHTGITNIEVDGVSISPHLLYDFLIPEGGFVIKGYYNEPTMKNLWKQLTSQNTVPVTTNNTLENTTKPGTLDKFYVSIDEDHKLSIRERLDSEKVVDGTQEDDTPSKNFTATDADNPIEYTKIETIAALANDATVSKVKGVITYLSNGNATIQDEDGNAILVYDNQLKDGYAVGDTIVIDGKKVTYAGYPEIKNLTSIAKVEKYGSVAPVTPANVTVDNVADVWTNASNYKLFKLVKAEVVSIDSNGISKVKIEDTEIALYKASFPETVAVGDYVDVVCSMQCYNDSVQGRVASASDISRYYNIIVDVDGVDGVEAPVTKPYATGDVVELAASNADANYQFSHWEKKVVGEDGTETWEKIGTTPEVEITVEEADAEYRAVYNYAAWALLPENMGCSLEETPKAVNADASFAVTTEGTFHQDGAWGTGLFNTQWRLIIVVDADGKIAYITHNPQNGYGGPSGTGYYAHPDYAGDYNTNPAFNILEGYGPWSKEEPSASAKFEVVVPEGGFIITAYEDDAAKIINALTQGQVTVANDSTTTTINSRSCPIDVTTRVFYDVANNQIKVFVPSVNEGNYLVTLNKNGYGTSTGIGVFVDDERNPLKSTLAEGRYTFDNANGWRYCFAVNAEGKIIYASYGLGAGYASPADDFYSDGTFTKSTSANKGTLVGDFFALGPNYAAWVEWNASTDPNRDETLDYGDYEALVPTGGFVVSGWNEDPNMNALWTEIFGKELGAAGAELNIDTTAAGTFDDVKVELVEVNGVPQIKVTNGHGNLPVITTPTIYTDQSTDVALGDITIAYDASGKIIFASRTSSGYGGPSDDFYHDGTYASVAGQTHGIFALDPQFAAWPAKVTIDGVEVNAWTLYDVVVPTGCTVVTGTEAQMLPIVNSLFSQTFTTIDKNTFFEGLEDGAYNNKVVKVTDGVYTLEDAPAA